LAGVGARTGRLDDLKPLAGLPLTDLEVHNNPDLRDLSPLRGMPLEHLNLNHAKVTDLSPLAGSRLNFLSLWECPVSDLGPLRSLPLNNLTIASAPVRDLGPLAGMKLNHLAIQNTRVDDLSPLRGMPLKTLTHDFRLWRDEEVLRTLPDLQWVVSRHSGEFWKHVQGLHAQFEEWRAKVAQLPPEEQVQAVVAELARDPRFDRRAVRHVVKDGRVTELILPAIGLDEPVPVRGLPGLRRLVIAGLPGTQAPFCDLSPLRGLPLEELDCSHTHVRNLRPLIGMPLTRLDITGTDVADLSPLRGLPLQHLRLSFDPAQVPALRELPMLQTINGQPRAAMLGPARP
jgi:Leucine-rich repeat (LRR) protein